MFPNCRGCSRQGGLGQNAAPGNILLPHLNIRLIGHGITLVGDALSYILTRESRLYIIVAEARKRAGKIGSSPVAE
jgi:hypothetical protein